MSARITISDGDADSVSIAAFERDRRDLLRRGFALGGAAFAASSVPLLLAVRTAFAQTSGDAEILENAITIERVTVIAYDAALAGGLLSPTVTAVAQRLRDHERRHAEVLTTALTDLGGTPPAAPKGAADVDKVVKGLSDVKTQGDVVNFAIELEMAAVAAYHDAHAKLVETRLLQTAASIMASDGQHLVVLRRLVRTNPIPNAFETGTT